MLATFGLTTLTQPLGTETSANGLRLEMASTGPLTIEVRCAPRALNVHLKQYVAR